MNFKRAKTILIIIFLFVNIFLIVINNLFYESDMKVDTKTVSGILLKSGITLKGEVLKDYPAAIPGIEIENIASDGKKLASLFLGKDYNSEKENYYTKNGSAPFRWA